MVVTIEREVSAPADIVWATVTHFPGHAAAFPLTTILTDAGPPQRGWAFTGRTGVGPVHVDDPMRVVEWAPPRGDAAGMCVIRKESRLLNGWARIEVEPIERDRSRLRWVEEIRPEGPDADRLPGFAARLVRGAPGQVVGAVVGATSDAASRVLYGHVVKVLAAQAERA